MSNEVQKRVRKSPEQQIQEARAALARAQQRQRQTDTRGKIVIGAIAQKWLQGNAQAARAFAAYVRALELREQDADMVESFIDQLGVSNNDAHHHANGQAQEARAD